MIACADYGYWTDENTVACYDTYNASNPFFSDTSPSNSFDRTWWWFCCNEPLFFWQEYESLSSHSARFGLHDPVLHPGAT